VNVEALDDSLCRRAQHRDVIVDRAAMSDP
jgi:hypothetical protein